MGPTTTPQAPTPTQDEAQGRNEEELNEGREEYAPNLRTSDWEKWWKGKGITYKHAELIQLSKLQWERRDASSICALFMIPSPIHFQTLKWFSRRITDSSSLASLASHCLSFHSGEGIGSP
jgi:hypothetical protein